MDKRTMWRRGAAGAAVLVAVVAVLTGIGPGGADRPANVSVDESQVVGASKAEQFEAKAQDVSSPSLPPGLGSPKVVKSASLEVEVVKGGFAAAFSKVSTIAAGHGGFVASSSSSQGGGQDDEGGQAAGTLVVRVPAEKFDAARRALGGLGELRSQRFQGDDVGGQLADLEARLRNLRSQEEAIRLLMAKTATIGETIEVQRQLGAVREQIERMSAEQARLGDAVDLSTLTLSLAEPGAQLNDNPDGSPIAAAFGRAVDGAEAVVGAVIVSLGYLLPLGMLLALAWLVAKPVIRIRQAIR